MESGGRSRDRPALACVDRLIPLGVRRLVGACDVGRKRDVSVLLDCLIGRQRSIELDDAGTTLGGGDYLSFEVIPDVNRAARLELAAWMHHRFPRRITKRAKEQNLGGSAVLPDAE